MDVLAPLVMAYLAGALPFSNLLALRLRGADLREVGTGTVSGTGLYRIAGFVPLVVAGLLDIAKGMVGPLLAGAPSLERPGLVAAAAGLAVAGHNWSPFLRGAGGRGLSPAMGALLVAAWPGTVLLLAGLAAGRLARQTGLGAFVATVLLAPALAWTHAPAAAFVGVAVAVPMLAKRLVGNARPREGMPRGRAYLTRLLLDRDQVS